MLCMFFFCVCVHETCRNNASISNTLGVVSDIKMNLVGTLRRSFLKFPKVL
ncbi:Uncharacterized protein FWK35_00013327 [Aphis craccivora]|uniref:Uncharacterized protein n=1 Tax=Aphis craccivora TaxID=307492 RepID=A0A6G0ZFE1_APHCR|nr:Uncharacterized protein FWK35_00013327 [Aphis craccivora]